MLCTIFASRVQLLFWPTPYTSDGASATITSAPSPRVSIGPDGFTFTSPSAYVIYSGLSAFGIAGDQGGSYDNITKAYAPTELSTIYSCSAPFYQTSRINFQDFNNPPRWSVISAHQGCDVCGQQYLYSQSHPGDELVTGYADMNFDQIPWLGTGASSWTLQPSIAAPLRITEIDPAWKYCTSLHQGIWDPPRIMTPADGMTPTATPEPPAAPSMDPAISPTSVASAEPVSKPIDHLPAPTNAQVKADPGASRQSEDPLPALSAAPIQVLQAPPLKAPGQSQAHPTSPSHSSAQGKTPIIAEDPPSDPAMSISALSTAIADPAEHSSADVKSPKDPSGQSKQPPVSVPTLHQGSRPDRASKLAVPSGSDVVINPSVQDDFNPAAASGQGKTLEPSQGNNEAPAASPSAPYDHMRPSKHADPVPNHHNELSGAVPTVVQSPGSGSELVVTPSIGIVAAGHTFTPLNADTVVAQGMTLSIGGKELSLKDSTLSMGKAGLIVGGSTIAIPSLGSTPLHASESDSISHQPMIITAGGETMTVVDQNQLLISGATLKQGANAATVSGKVISLGISAAIVGTTTVPLPSLDAAGSFAPIITAAGQAITKLAGDKFVVDGNTLAAGSPAIAISGQTISYGASGLVVGSSTISIPTPVASPPLPPFTAAGATFTPLPNNLVAVEGKTLTPGATAETMAGNVISLASSALVIGSSTVVLSSVETSTSTPLGNVIMSGFGPGSGNSTTGFETFTGAASGRFKLPRRLPALATVFAIGCTIWGSL